MLCDQANTYDELPEKLIGAVRVSHVELSSAIVPTLDAGPTESTSWQPVLSYILFPFIGFISTHTEPALYWNQLQVKSYPPPVFEWNILMYLGNFSTHTGVSERE